MEIQPILGVAAAVVATAAYIPYIISILKGKTKPNRATWLIWAVLGIIICASYWFVGARSTFWYTLPVGMITIALISLKYGVGGWTPFDRICLIGAAAGLLLWWVSGIPFTALAAGMLIDIIGYFPTMKKVWHDPGSEDRLTWGIFFVAAVLNLMAVDRWTLEIATYPAYIIVFNSIMLALLFRPLQKSKNIS
jgi:hypothetical protein